MSWSYSGNPASSDRDMVRFRIGDTIAATPLLTNEEIDALLTTMTVTQTAIASAYSLAARYARMGGSKKVGDLSISYGDLAGQYRALARQLASEPASMTAASTWVGGVSYAERSTLRSDDDYIRPAFEGDMLREDPIDDVRD